MPARIRLEHPERCIACLNCLLACSRELFGSSSTTRVALQVRTSSLSSPPIIAICVACRNPPCAAACPHGALAAQPEGGPTLVNPSKCPTCETKDCSKACVTGALPIDPLTGRPIVCTQCGACAKFCPHEVITYGEVRRA